MTDKENREGTVWGYLRNILYLLSASLEELENLKSPIFDPMDELDSALINGLNDESLEFFVGKSWLSNNLVEDLMMLRDFIRKIPSKSWTLEEFFDEHSDWVIARGWGNRIKKELGESIDGWDSSGEIIIWTG